MMNRIKWAMYSVTVVVLAGCYPPGAGRNNSDLNFSYEVAEKLNTQLGKDPKIKAEACSRNQVTLGIFNGERTSVVEWHKDIPVAEKNVALMSRGLNDESFTQSQWKNFYQFVRNHLRTSSECRNATLFLAVFDGPLQNDSIIVEIIGGKIAVSPGEIPLGFFEEDKVDDYKDLVGLRGNSKVELDLTTDLPGLMAKFVEKYPKTWKSVDYTITVNMHGGSVDTESTLVDLLATKTTSKPIIMFDPNSSTPKKGPALYAAPILRKKSIVELCKGLAGQKLDENHICRVINKPSYDFAPFQAWLALSPLTLKTILTGQISPAHIQEFNDKLNINRRSVSELILASNGGSGTAGEGQSVGTSGDGNGGTSGDGNGGTSGDGNGGTSGDGNGGTSGDGNGGTSGDGNGGTSGDGPAGTSGDIGGTAGDGNGSSGKEFMRIQFVNLSTGITHPTRTTVEGRALASPALDYTSPGLRFNLPLASSRSLVMINSCYQKPDLVRAIFAPTSDASVSIGVLYNDAPVYTWITDYEFFSDLHFRTLSNFLSNANAANPIGTDLKQSLAQFGFSPKARVAADMAARLNHGQAKSYLAHYTAMMTAYANLEAKYSGFKFELVPLAPKR